MIVGEVEAEQVERRRIAAVETAGDGLRILQDVLADEDEPIEASPR